MQHQEAKRDSVGYALLAQPAITVLQGGSLINRHFFSHCSGGWTSKVKVPSGLLSGKSFLLGHITVSSDDLCALRERRGEIAGISSSIETPVLWN